MSFVSYLTYPFRYFISHPARLDFDMSAKEHVSKEAIDKIYSFVRNELKIDPKNLHIINNPNVDDDFAQGSGSFKPGKKAFLYLRPNLLRSIERNFTYEHKFIIAHEIAHLIKDDLGAEDSALIANEKRILVLYVIVMVAIAVFTRKSVFWVKVGSIISTHITACNVAILIARKWKKKICVQREFAADAFAAKLSVEIAEAGAKLFKATQSANLKWKREKLALLQDKGNISSERSKALRSEISLITDLGDYITFSHPLWSDRISRIEAIIAQHKQKKASARIF